MLSAGAARAVDVDAKIRRIDLDVDVVFHLGRDEHRRERGMPAIARIERRLAHQPVHAGLGAQPAEGVVTLHPDRRALDARDLAGRHLDELALEAAPLGPAQIHAQQHLGPVLRLGAAGARLDIEEGVGGVHRPGEHPLEFECAQALVERVQIGLDRGGGFLVLFLGRELQQLGRVVQTGAQRLQSAHLVLETSALLAECLRLIRIVPDLGIFELAVDFFQALALGVKVKDTPSERQHALACL